MAERSALDGWIDSGAGWRLFPHLIVRTTGFAFDVLDRLRYPEAGRAAAEIAKHEATLEGLRADGPRLRMPPRAVLAALRAGRPVLSDDPGAFADWNAAANALLQARARLEKAVAEEGPRAQQALRALVQEPRFSEAIACSSPPVFEDIARARWNNRLDRQLASYAQRLCAKNETMGFFGPINYGLVAPEQHNGVHLTWPGPEPLSGRKTYLASWAVQAIWQRIAFEPEIAPWLVLRRKAFSEAPTPREPNPADLLPRLVKEADGSRTLSSLAQRLELELPETIELGKLGCRKGLLSHQLEIPSAAPHPLDDLAMRLAGIPGPGAQRALGQLDDLRRVLMRRYGSASAAEKVSLNERVAKLVAERWQASPPTARASGDEAERRGSGHNFYVDRLPLREECGGKLELRIEGERARELATRCARALDLMGLAALRTRELARAEVARALGERTVPFWKLVAALGDRAPVRDRAVEEAIRAAITDPSAREVSLGALTLPETPASPLPQITSVDLLVDAPDLEAWARGDYRLMMGDVHDTALVWGWALQFHPEAGLIEAQMAAGLGALTRAYPAVTILPARRTGLLPAELPGAVVELGGVSVRPSAWRVPFDDLFVEGKGGTVRLMSRRLQSEVFLHNGELESLVHTAFALPRIRPVRVDLGAHTPRLLIDGVVVQREQWTLSSEQVTSLLAVKGESRQLEAAAKLWALLGAPERVFAKFGGERKPVLVDVHSPPSLRVFLNLLEKKQSAVLSEMYPGPEGLWLRGPEGRHTAELRCTFVRDGAAP